MKYKWTAMVSFVLGYKRRTLHLGTDHDTRQQAVEAGVAKWEKQFQPRIHAFRIPSYKNMIVLSHGFPPSQECRGDGPNSRAD